MTLIELSVVMMLLGVVVSAILATLYSAQRNFERESSRSISNDQLRLAIQAIDREVRSGDVIYDPGAESFSGGDVAAGNSLRIYTESNAPTRGGTAWCVQWRITSSGALQHRRWIWDWTNANDPNQVVKWRTEATGLTNRTDGIAAFARPVGSSNLLNVRLRVNNDASKGSTVEAKQSISGRNTQLYQNKPHCGPPTPDPAQSAAADGSKVPPY